MSSESEQIKAHEGLARHMARRYGLDDEDGYQAARIGVMLALRRFDPSRGTQFSTLAVWLIRKELQDEMRVRRAISMQDSKRHEWDKVRKARSKHPDASDAEIAAKAGMSVRRLRVFDAISSMNAKSMDYRRDDGRSLAEYLGDGLDIEGLVADESERSAISAAIDSLGQREALIVRLRFSGMTQRDVAAQIGISKSRVGQLETMSMDKLRRVLLTLLSQ